MNAINEAREHLKTCNGCEKELTPSTIGDLVLGFNSLLVDVQRDAYRNGREDQKKRVVDDREQASERAQVEADHRRELNTDPPQRIPIVGTVKS